MPARLTDEHDRDDRDDGFTIVRGFLSGPEVDRLHEVARSDRTIAEHSYELPDSTGKRTRLASNVFAFSFSSR